MRFGLQTWGSHGDVEPFMALAAGLAAAGHDVRLCVTTQADKQLVSPPGVELRRVGDAMGQADGDALFDRVIAQSSPMMQGRLVLEEGLLPFADSMFEAARELAGQSDVVVRHHFLYMTQAAAQLARVPEVSVFLTPDLLPTRQHPPTGMPRFAPLHGLAWWMANKGISSVFGAPAQELRRRVGLPASKGVLTDVWVSSHANLVAVSPTLFAPPADWPRHHHLTGFWRAPSAAEAELSAELDAFLDAGEPPVFASFGSIGGGVGARRSADANLLIGAAREAGTRLILQQPPGDPPEAAGEDVFVVSRAPHARVFPRCAAVVHHGGAGTTQTAISAGTPSVIVPHLADQFFWGAQVERLGVGRAAPARARITVPQLGRAIAAVASDVGMRSRVADVGRSLATEDGVAAAVAALESMAH